MPGICLNCNTFRSHMIAKTNSLLPTELELGNDFAIFHFNWAQDQQNAERSLRELNEFYGYRIYVDQGTRVCVVNN